MYIHPFKCPLYHDKVSDNAFMISSVFSIVKSVDLPNKKYAGKRRNVHRFFSIFREYDIIL